MPIAIWLRLGEQNETQLRALIEELACTHGTPRFEPHLTVCSGELDRASFAGAFDYLRMSQLPLIVQKKGISWSTVAPLRAVVIDVDDSPSLRDFRATLQKITGAAAAYPPPHISLLYSLDEHGQRVEWSADKEKLRFIAEECAMHIAAREFVLDRPAVVTADRGWTKVGSWQIAPAM
jgi:hypothetical protein